MAEAIEEIWLQEIVVRLGIPSFCSVYGSPWLCCYKPITLFKPWSHEKKGIIACHATDLLVGSQQTRRWINVGLTLVQRRRRWTNGKTTLIQRLVSAGLIVWELQQQCTVILKTFPSNRLVTGVLFYDKKTSSCEEILLVNILYTRISVIH